MAIHIYFCTEKELGDTLVIWNDIWFNMNFYKKKEVTPEIQRLMIKIDGAVYAGDSKVYSKFNGSLCSLTELSTGLKTVINCTTFKDKIFSCGEVGENALQEILSLKDANIWFPNGLLPIYYDILNDFVLHTHCNNTEKYKSYYELFEGVKRNGKIGD